ncbi:MAG: TIGR02147 family protein [Bdellovibrionia bacterium]
MNDRSTLTPVQNSRARPLPRVYEYSDFRLYLREVYKIRKSSSRHWTYDTWAKKLGLKSSSTLIMILQGSRNPGPKLAQALASSLELKPNEAHYFQDLISLEKAKKNPHLHVVLLERLRKQNPVRSFRMIDRDSFSAISNWYCYAIREMVDLKDFREDPEWIQARLHFKVSKKEITDAIESLLRLGLLERDENGFLKYAPGAVSTGNDLHNEGLKRFHEQTLENAKQALRLIDPKDREISGVTFTLNREDIPKAKEILRRAHHEILNIAAKSNADGLFQLETVLFPLARMEEDPRD